jgi:hypothetical protein
MSTDKRRHLSRRIVLYPFTLCFEMIIAHNPTTFITFKKIRLLGMRLRSEETLMRFHLQHLHSFLNEFKN